MCVSMKSVSSEATWQFLLHANENKVFKFTSQWTIRFFIAPCGKPNPRKGNTSCRRAGC